MTTLRSADPATTVHDGGAEPHPRTLGWFDTAALSMGSSKQSPVLLGALPVAQAAPPSPSSP